MPERLGDPMGDRRMADVLTPYVGYLEDEKLFPVESLPDWQLII